MMKPKRRRMWMCLLWMFVALWGCENPDRFSVPDYKRKVKEPHPYQVKGKVELPRGLPTWTELTGKQAMRLFQPEPVSLQGQQWLREGASAVHTYYFQRSNHLAVRELLQVTDSVARGLSRWLGKPFRKRLHVVLMPQKDPKDPITPFKGKLLKLPDVGSPRLVIYTGTDLAPYLSKHGLVGKLIELTARVALTGSTEESSKDLWRSSIIPAYFRLRGTGAMIDKSYNRTARIRFLSELRHAGRPDTADLLRQKKLYEAGEIPFMAKKRTQYLLASLFGFLEDGYGQGALAAVLREVIKDKQGDLSKSAKKVIGEPLDGLWKRWQRFYYSDLWRQLVEGKVL